MVKAGVMMWNIEVYKPEHIQMVLCMNRLVCKSWHRKKAISLYHGAIIDAGEHDNLSQLYSSKSFFFHQTCHHV